MKTGLVITSAIIGLTLAAPVAAHHNCAAGDACPDEIGDMMGNHEAAYTRLTETMLSVGGSVTAAMDPADEADGDARLPAGAGTWSGSDPNQGGW